MSDAGEGLVDAEARLLEQMDAREHDRKRRGPKVEDPEKHRATESLKLARNPDVTVRSYGVMEKCTYCVQRISQARIAARREDRSVRDGEVVTACQQACPAGAIVFGDLNDPASQVATRKRDARNYSLLGDLNTRPRTTYLASVRNPNPELERDAEKPAVEKHA